MRDVYESFSREDQKGLFYDFSNVSDLCWEHVLPIMYLLLEHYDFLHRNIVKSVH